MKDFQEFLDKKPDDDHKLIMKSIQAEQTSIQTWRSAIQNKVLPLISPFLLSIITGPFTTTSIFLQVASRKLGGSGIEAKIKAAPMLERHINNGLFGDNKIYEAVNANGYKEAFNKLGKEGIRGLYKGNLTGILLAASNSWVRQKLYVSAGKNGLLKDQLQSNILTVATCTLADIITLPLMAAQSRLILQNSSPHFRTYSSFISVWRKAQFKHLFFGIPILLLKNIVFNVTWVKFIPESPVYSFVISTIASHLFTYPFVTVLRQLQVSQPGVPMMQNRSENTISCSKRIYNQAGFKGFYRGFLAYAAIHSFIGALMIQGNLRSGYFDSQ